MKKKRNLFKLQIFWGNMLVNQILEKRPMPRGWGAPLESDLRLGVSRYEFCVFHKGVLKKVFRTNAESCRGVVEIESQRYMALLRRRNPRGEYNLKTPVLVEVN